MTDHELLALSERNIRQARDIIRHTGVMEAFADAGGEAHVVGSVAMDLMMTHRDIDIHAYTPTLTVKDSFAVMEHIAECPNVTRMKYRNLLATDEACMEWHAWYAGEGGNELQLDIIHIQKGSRYDGYFERMAEHIKAALTPETRLAILRLKAETPCRTHVPGVEIYQAVLRDGVRTWADFAAWRKEHYVEGIIEWMP